MRQPAYIQKEKILARYVLGISSVVMFVVWNVAASTPSHLSHTLKAQEDVVAERPYDAEVYNDLGNLLALDDRHQEAEEAYRKAIELAPTDTLARFNLGVLLQQEGRWRDAQKELRSLLEIDDRHGKTYYQLGILFESRGQRGRAVEHYAKAFAFDPDLTFAYNNPHLIDNEMATEAMLKSGRYGGAGSAETPRLYGEPERIANLMLSDPTTSEEPVAVAGVEESEEMPVSRVGHGARLDGNNDAGNGPAERAAYSSTGRNSRLPSADEADEVDGGSRRTLTSSDLDAGSNIGQAQRAGASGRRRPAIGVGNRSKAQGNAAGRADRQPATRQRAIGGSGSAGNASSGVSSSDSTAASGRASRSRRPSYRPRSRLSTGRLELQLLPVEATDRYAKIDSEHRERGLEEPES